MSILSMPRLSYLTSDGVPVVGAYARFYLSGTTTPVSVYEDATFTTAFGVNSCRSLSDGYFPIIYFDPQDGDIKCVLTDSSDANAVTIDPITPEFDVERFYQALYPITTAETTEGVTPSSYRYPLGDIRRYGASDGGVINAATAIQSAIDAASATPSSGGASKTVRLDSESGKYLCSTGITFDPQKITFDGQGNTLDFSAVTSAISCLKASATGENVSRTFLWHSTRGIRNLNIEVPSYTVNANAVGLELADEEDDGSGNYRAGGIHIENVSIIGGKYGLKFGNGAWGSTIVNCVIGHDVGNLLDTAVYAPSPLTDGQESARFFGGLIFNGFYGFRFEVGDVKVIGTNIDGCRTIGRLEGNGTMAFHGGYSEFTDGDNTQHKFATTDANATIFVTDWVFVVRPDVLPTRTLAFASNDGSIVLRDCIFKGSNTAWYQANGGFLVEGNGSVKASGLVYKNFSWAPLVSKKLQWLAYPDINNANALAGFTLSNVGTGDDPVRATSISDGTTTKDAIHFSINNTGVLNDESSAEFIHAAEPGKMLSVVGMVYAPALTGSNVRLELVVTWRDVDGNTISGPFTETLATTTQATWTQFGFSDTAPAGTESVRVLLRTRATGAVGADTEVYVSPLGIGYADGE